MGKFSPIDFAPVDKAVFIQQLRRRGIKDEAVIRAMEQVPREEFVGVELVEALLLQPEDRVLEVGADPAAYYPDK